MIQIKSKLEDFDKTAAMVIAESITAILSTKDYVVLAIPGGRTVPGVFKALMNENVPWEKIHIFMVDERLVPLDDSESNFRLAKSFVEKLPAENVHPFILDRKRLEMGISNYTMELQKFGGFDIVLLSAGEDGHVAALFPEHHSIKDSSEGFISMSDSPKPPGDRMTASVSLILKANTVVLLFKGESKKEALKKFLATDDPYVCPAALVKQIPRAFVLTDLEV